MNKFILSAICLLCVVMAAMGYSKYGYYPPMMPYGRGGGFSFSSGGGGFGGGGIFGILIFLFIFIFLIRFLFPSGTAIGTPPPG